MLIIPAINIKNGVCVALENNQIESANVYSEDLADVVGRWFDKEVERLHLIDLDGVKSCRPVNTEVISQLAFRFPNLSMLVSGGLRSLGDIEMYLKAGLDFVALGTKAFQDPEFIKKASLAFPGKIILTIDSKDGRVLVEGRSKQTNVDVCEFASQFDLPSLAGVILSDQASCQGLNIDAVAKLASQMTIPVMAAGGVEDMDDVRALFSESHKGITGVISSRALREGRLDINEAQAYCDQFDD